MKISSVGAHFRFNQIIDESKTFEFFFIDLSIINGK